MEQSASSPLIANLSPKEISPAILPNTSFPCVLKPLPEIHAQLIYFPWNLSDEFTANSVTTVCWNIACWELRRGIACATCIDLVEVLLWVIPKSSNSRNVKAYNVQKSIFTPGVIMGLSIWVTAVSVMLYVMQNYSRISIKLEKIC